MIGREMGEAKCRSARSRLLVVIASSASAVAFLSAFFKYEDGRQFIWLLIVLSGGALIMRLAFKCLNLQRGSRWDGFGRAAAGVASIAGGVGKAAFYIITGDWPDYQGFSRIGMFLCVGCLWLLEEHIKAARFQSGQQDDELMRSSKKPHA